VVGGCVKETSARYSNILFDFQGAHVDTIRPTLKQFDKLAQKYPEVAKRLEYIGTYQGKGAPSGMAVRATAHATKDGKQIGLNPKWYGNPDKFSQACTDMFTTKWMDADGSIESIFSHEFGHQVEHWLLNSNQAFSRYIGADGAGIVSDTVRLFNKVNKPTNALSGYAVTTNSIKTTQYQEWVTDKVEGWAEAFAAIQHKPRSQWTTYVKRISMLIDEAGDTSKWIDPDSAVFAFDLRRSDSVEYQKALDAVNAIRERLNL